jgi:lysyl-tRNA synthetase class 2
MDEPNRLEEERRAKLARFRASGGEPYPWEFPGRVGTDQARAACAELAPGAVSAAAPLRVAGRIRALRTHGKASFADLEDFRGSIQLLFRSDTLGDDAYQRALDLLDPGDLVGADGPAVVSKRGEPSIEVKSLTLLAKAIAPPPDKYHGLQDPEERLRRRYLDLLGSPESRERFVVRTRLLQEIRRVFDDAGFLEVETAVLGPIASGAAAHPFVTRSNFLDQEVRLRIATELALKRLVVGGFEKVYELGKSFRNEDLDTTHSPEFTELEAYWAYADYRDMRGLIEQLFARLADTAVELSGRSAEAEQRAALFRPPFPTVDFVEALERESRISGILSKSREELAELARHVGSTVPSTSTSGVFLDKLFEHYVEPTFDRVTFVVDHPEATTPLAKRHRSKSGRVERFEVFFPGFELGNAYTELNDPDEQAARFRAQLAEKGVEQYAYDDDFVKALQHGLPPTTGVGLGIDRIVMALTGATSIKDVLFFPLLRSRVPAPPSDVPPG